MDHKVASTHAKIVENFANYFLKNASLKQVHYMFPRAIHYKYSISVSMLGKTSGQMRCDTLKQPRLKKLMQVFITCLDLCGISFSIRVIALKNIFKGL